MVLNMPLLEDTFARWSPVENTDSNTDHKFTEINVIFFKNRALDNWLSC